MLRHCLAVVAGLTFMSVASAQVGVLSTKDANWPQEQYKLTVQVNVQAHPLMTPAFVDGLVRELRDTLQSDLGHLCEVTVTSAPSATMKDIVAKGWGQLEKPHPITTDKTHYVRVLLLEGGQYEIQARQVDGHTGTLSPLRKARTSDRLWVARQAALLVTKDFGVVGVVTNKTVDSVRVALKGAKLAEPDSVKVQAGEVLAIVKMVGSVDRLVPYPVEGALLYVTGVQEATGECTTRLFNRYDNVKMGPPPERGVAGFRVIKLGTTWAPLQLRIIDKKTREPQPGVSVSIARGGFVPGYTLVPIGATDAQGRVRSNEIFKNVAFVQLTLGGQQKGGIPLPLMDDQFVDFALAGTQEAGREAEFDVYLRQWGRRMNERYLQLNAEKTEIKALLVKGKLEEAVNRGKEAVTRLKEDVAEMRDELTKLKERASEVGPSATAGVASGDKYVDRLAAQVESFEKSIVELADTSPAGLKIREARSYEEEAEPVKAMEAYDAAVKIDPSKTVAKTRLEALKKVWENKAPDLAEARAFIFETWPTLDTESLERRQGEVKKHLATLEKHGDYLTALKLWKINFTHRERLLGARQGLKPETSDDDDFKAKQIDQLVEIINDLNERALELQEKAK